MLWYASQIFMAEKIIRNMETIKKYLIFQVDIVLTIQDVSKRALQLSKIMYIYSEDIRNIWTAKM
jgi:hypothetical protein